MVCLATAVFQLMASPCNDWTADPDFQHARTVDPDSRRGSHAYKPRPTSGYHDGVLQQERVS